LNKESFVPYRHPAGKDAISRTDRWLTPPAIAKTLGVDPHRVLGWIRAGKLAAVDLSDGTRPRYRVAPEALEAYLESRAVVAPTHRVNRRQPQSPNIKKFF
jgi:hypothetical protein